MDFIFLNLLFGGLILLFIPIMMGKKDFDNIQKIINGGVVFTGTATASLEIDFELPRGYIAKIFRIEVKIFGWGDDIRTVSADKNYTMEWALLRDPDDTTTTGLTGNVVEHDVVFSAIDDVLMIAGTAGDGGIWTTIETHILEIPEHIDLFTARNMRLNVVAGDDDAADVTEAGVGCNIFYTLEPVDDADILNLLDIL